MPISAHIPAQELAECLHEHSMHLGVLPVPVDEGYKRCQEAVGLRLTIDAVDDIGLGKVVFPLKLQPHLLGEDALEQIAQKRPAQHCPTALVAQDKAQRRHMSSDGLSVVEAAVGPCTQNAGYTRPAAAQSAGRSQQVTLHLYAGLGEYLLQHIVHCLRIGLHAPCPIEEYLGRLTVCRQLWHKLLRNDTKYGILGVTHGIDAQCVHFQNAILTAGQCPVGLCGAAVSHQYDIGLAHGSF